MGKLSTPADKTEARSPHPQIKDLLAEVSPGSSREERANLGRVGCRGPRGCAEVLGVFSIDLGL